jgi:hypothetical protein
MKKSSAPLIMLFIIRNSLALVLGAMLSVASAREWTSADGRVMEAELLGYEAGEVTLQRPDKTRVRVRLDLLSEGDRNFIESWRSSRTETEQLPPVLWPATVVGPTIQVSPPEERDGLFVFQSPRFQFASDAKVSASVMTDFANNAEGVVRFFQALPLRFPPPGDERYRARLFQKRETYEAAGGAVNSAGYYQFHPERGGELLVPWESLGIEAFLDQNTKARHYDPNVLIHELAHQATGDYLPLMPSWLREGLAEYCVALRDSSGVYRFTQRERTDGLKKRLEYHAVGIRNRGGLDPAGSGGRSQPLASPLLLPSGIVALPESAWSTAGFEESELGLLQKRYATAMVIVAHLFHEADEGEATRMRLYGAALEKARLFVATRGREGSLPEGVGDGRRLDWDNLQVALVKTLLPDEALARLDEEVAETCRKWTLPAFER